MFREVHKAYKGEDEEYYKAFEDACPARTLEGPEQEIEAQEEDKYLYKRCYQIVHYKIIYSKITDYRITNYKFTKKEDFLQ